MQEAFAVATTILLALGGGGGIVLSLSGYLGKIWAQRLMDREKAAHERDLELLRSELRRHTEADLEHLKASLSAAALEHEVRFSKLHDKRATVLADLYKLLVAATWQTTNFSSPFHCAGYPGKQAQYKTAMDSIAEYYRFFDQHRIWLPSKLCGPLEEFAKQLRTPTIGLGVYVGIEYPNADTRKEHAEASKKAWDSIQNEIPRLRAAIEGEFRVLLGATENVG